MKKLISKLKNNIYSYYFLKLIVIIISIILIVCMLNNTLKDDKAYAASKISEDFDIEYILENGCISYYLFSDEENDTEYIVIRSKRSNGVSITPRLKNDK